MVVVIVVVVIVSSSSSGSSGSGGMVKISMFTRSISALGACDGVSVLSLFRRKVKNVIICDAIAYDIINDVDINGEKICDYYQDIYCLFGKASEAGQPRGFNEVYTLILIAITVFACSQSKYFNYRCAEYSMAMS